MVAVVIAELFPTTLLAETPLTYFRSLNKTLNVGLIFKKESVPTVGIVEPSMVISAKEVAPEKAEAPMLVTDDGNVIAAKEVAPEKADAPILVIDDGNVIAANEVAPENAEAPILVINVGIVIVDKLA